MSTPCKDCTKRYPGCHDKCAGYLDFKKERELIRKNRGEYNEIRYADKTRTHEAIKKIRKKVK